MKNNSVLVVSCDPSLALHSLVFESNCSPMVRHQFERGVDCLEALAHYDRLNGTVIVVDSRVQDMPSLNVVDAIRTCFPHIGIVVVLEDSSQDSIQRAMLAGAKGAVLRSCTTDELILALDRVSNSLSSDGSPRFDSRSGTQATEAGQGAVVGVFGAHGGSGKTATSLSVSSAFALKGIRTLFLDLDIGFGDSVNVLPNILSISLREMESYGKATFEHQEGLCLAPHLDAVRLSREFSEPAVSSNALTRIFDNAKHQYEVIVFNTGAYAHLLHSDLMRNTHQSLCLFDHTIPSIRAAQQLVEALSSAEVSTSKYRLVVNRFSRDGLTLADLETALGGAAISSIPLLSQRQILQLDTQKREDFLQRKTSYSLAINELCEYVALAAGIQVRSSEEIRITRRMFGKDRVVS